MVAHQMTVPALARACDIPERTIARYRAGTSEPRDSFGEPTANARALADALGVDVSELLDSPHEFAS